ncbi:hypothetical protein KC571_02750 [candidate division WWE3 bacterium]|uniref:Uncharacterized protein n=1 Tax=candidate division WWE3 bacterium TaxID=2053526 RepID=A0A955LGY7_UNCKA|nr:hypothetical protein [candidate division WWE3 bacterium]
MSHHIWAIKNKIGYTLVAIGFLVGATAPSIFAVVDFQSLDIQKISGSIIEVQGNLISIQESENEVQKVYIPNSTKIEHAGGFIQRQELYPGDEIELLTHEKNVALYVEVLNKVAAPPQVETTPGDAVKTAQVEDLTSAVGRNGLRLSIGAGVVLAVIIGFAVSLVIISNRITAASQKNKKKISIS